MKKNLKRSQRGQVYYEWVEADKIITRVPAEGLRKVLCFIFFFVFDRLEI